MIIFLVLATFYSDENDKNRNRTKFSHYRLFLVPGIKFLGKNTAKTVYLKNIERIFFDHFLTKINIFAINQHLKILEG